MVGYSLGMSNRPSPVSSKILELLRSDPTSRHSYRTIAEAVGTAPETVCVLIARLKFHKKIETVESFSGPGGGTIYRVLVS